MTCANKEQSVDECNDESAYREEVHTLTNWCHNNNLSLNISKTKELVVEFRRRTSVHPPHHHRQDSSGAGQQLQVPWRSHHRGSHLDYSHTVSSEEGPPASLLPQATEELHRSQPESPAENSSDGPAHRQR